MIFHLNNRRQGKLQSLDFYLLLPYYEPTFSTVMGINPSLVSLNYVIRPIQWFEYILKSHEYSETSFVL